MCAIPIVAAAGAALGKAEKDNPGGTARVLHGLTGGNAQGLSAKVFGENSAINKGAAITTALNDPAGLFGDTKGNTAVESWQQKSDWLGVGAKKRATNAKWNAYYAQQRQFGLQTQRNVEDKRTLLAG